MTTIDDIGRRAAADELTAAGLLDVERGLADILEAVPTADLIPLRPAHSPRRRVLAVSAAAIVIAVVAVTIFITRGRGTPHVNVPTTPVVTVPTTDPSTTTAPGTTVPTVVASGLSVSYLDPPPIFEPVPFTSVDLSSCSGTCEWAVMEGQVVGVDDASSSAVVVDSTTGEVRIQPLSVVPSMIIGGPRDVIYGLVQGDRIADFAMQAIALSGDRAGDVVASSPVAAVTYVELPQAAFGHGDAGVIDRVRVPGKQMIGYVDETGQPTTQVGDRPSSLYSWDGTSVTSNGMTWPLQITAHPESAQLINGPPIPSPTRGGAVAWTWIGPGEGGSDFGTPTMPVVAWLTSDGNAVWRQLADGWAVAASDLPGTLLVRTTATQIELAWLTPPGAALPPTPTTSAPTTTAPAVDAGFDLSSLGFVNECEPTQCESLVAAADGTIVSFDRTTSRVTFHGATLRVVDVAAIDGADPVHTRLVHIGPGDVAYFETSPINASDPVGDLVAVALSGPRAGQVVARTEGGTLDQTGDSQLVPTANGMVVVGCCGFEPQRPANGAPVVLGWVDVNGNPTTDSGPVMQLDFVDGALVVTRHNGATSRSWTVPNVPIGYRGMPPVTATTDGGAMVFLQESFDSESPSRLAVLHADGSIEERSIAPNYPAVMVPDGTMVVYVDGWQRLTLR